jgi:hypothetical protein
MRDISCYRGEEVIVSLSEYPGGCQSYSIAQSLAKSLEVILCVL